MKKIILICITATFCFGFTLSKSAQKKVNKTIAALWQNTIITKNAINLNAIQKQKISFKLDNNNLFSLHNANNIVGYLFISRARGKSDFFDYMIIFKPDLSILTVKLLAYREEYGGEIGSNRWLKQFKGKSEPTQIKFGDNIQNISGATISSRAITADIKKSTKKLHELKLKGIIK